MKLLFPKGFNSHSKSSLFRQAKFAMKNSIEEIPKTAPKLQDATLYNEKGIIPSSYSKGSVLDRLS